MDSDYIYYKAMRDARHDAVTGRFVSIISPSERFWSKVQKTDSCWNWMAFRTKQGYGRFVVGRRNGRALSVDAHRFAYEQSVGPIPKGLVLDHLCRNKACVNPAHLEPVTNWENTLRGENFIAVNTRKTHCPKGHPYNGDNLYINTYGYRVCKTCVKERYIQNREIILARQRSRKKQ